MILLFFFAIELNLYCNKDTFLVGEDIWIRWEIVNKGSDIEFYEENDEFRIFNMPYLEREKPGGDILKKRRFKLWNEKGNEVPYRGIIIEGMIVVPEGSVFKIPKPYMDTLKPGDTVSFKEVNLIGDYGNVEFKNSLLGFGDGYLKSGEYNASLLYRIKKNDEIKKISSNKMHFYVEEPEGKELWAWISYRDIRNSMFGPLYVNRVESMKKANFLLRELPSSNYAGSVMEFLGNSFFYTKIEDEREEFKKEARELMNYLEDNIQKFADRSNTLESALFCIIKGEAMLLTPHQEVLDLIDGLGVPYGDETIEEIERLKTEE